MTVPIRKTECQHKPDVIEKYIATFRFSFVKCRKILITHFLVENDLFY